MSFIADMIINRPDDGAKVEGGKILPAGGEIVRLLNSSGNTNGSGTAGNDEFIGTQKNDIIRGNNGNDTLSGGLGKDLINGQSGNDIINGDNGNDTLFGGSGDDKVSGGLGNDLIIGGKGKDELTGGNGNDLIAGGNGDDLLRGDKGNDVLEGGTGKDTFVFRLGSDIGSGVINNNDVVADFQLGVDILDFVSPNKFTFNGIRDSSNNFVIQVIGAGDITRGTITFNGLDSSITGFSGYKGSQVNSLFA